MNQKHEADVCLHLQGVLAVLPLASRIFGRCQNLEFWHDSVTLPVRPGLLPAFLLFKSESGLSRPLLLLTFELEDRVAGSL